MKTDNSMHLFCDRAFEEATYGPAENTYTKISSSKDFVIVNNIWYICYNRKYLSLACDKNIYSRNIFIY